MGSIMSHCNLAGSGADQTARTSFHSILLGRAIGFLTRLGQASVRFGMHVRAKLVSCKEYLLDLLKVCKNSAMARMSRKSACSTSSGVSTSATVELVNLTIGKATHPTNVLVSTCGSAATSKLASVGVAGLIKVNAFNLGNVENTVSANLRPITSANVEPTAITNVSGISRPSKQAFALVAVVTAVLVATGAVMQASPSVKAKISTSTKAKFKTKAKTSAKVKVKTEPDSPGIAKNTSQAHLESTVMANVESPEVANVESLEVANVESLEVANLESPEVANVESLEVANVEAVAEPNVLLNVEPNVSEPVTLADVEAAGPAIAKSAELPSVDLTELTDEGVLSPSHVELTHSAAADAASLDHIAATDSVGGVAVETASPINTASDDSVDTDITDLADEGVAGSAHVELITSVNVEPASASNGEMVTPLKAETILASKNATKKAIKKTFDLVNVVSAVLAATGASVAKVKPPSSLAKIKKKVKSSTSTKTKAKTKSKTKAKTSAKVKDKTVSDSPGIAKNTSQAHLESTVMANVESSEVANLQPPEVANLESLEVVNVEAVAEPNVLLNVEPNVSEPVTLADVEATGPAIAKSAELPSVDLTELTDEGVFSPSHVELTHSAAADAASLDHIAATDSVGGVAVETASPINTASDDSVDTNITDLADEGVAGSAHVELIPSVNVEPASASNVEMVTPLKAETILASKNATKKAIKKTFDLVNVVSAVLAATGASVAKVKPPSSLAKIKKKIKSSTSTKTKSKTKSKTKAKTSAKVKDKTVSDSPGIAKNTSQAHLESTVMANVESPEVANVESPEVANVESLEVANVEAVAEPNVLLNVEPNVSEPVTLADVEAAGPAIAKSAELPSVDLTELTDEGVLSPSHVELTHSAAADAASLDHIAATDSVGGVAVETASPINTASDDSVDTDITDLADEGVAGSAHVELITSVNVEPASASNGEMVTPLKAETILASKNATKKAIKKTFDLVNVVSAVLAATGASVAKVKPPSSLAKIKKKVKSSTSTKTKAKTKSKTKAKTSAKVKDKTVSDSPGIAKNTSQAHLESTVMANVESSEVANLQPPEVANLESLEVVNVEAVAEPNVLLNVEPNVSEPVTLADVEATGPAIAKSAELPSVDLTELTDEGVFSPSHVELTHSAAADAASLDHIAATDSVGGVAVETASPINTASDDSVDTNITDLADEGVAGSAHVELIPSVNVEPASASNVEMVTPLKAETILASKNATKKAIKKTFDLVNVVSAVLAATGASVAKVKPPSSLAKIKKKIKSSTSTKTKSKTKSKTKAKTSAKVKDKTVSDSPGIAKNTSQAHLESTVMANVESPEVANVESPEVANVESLEVANVEAVAEPNVLLNVEPNVSEPVTLADVEAAGPAIAKSAELPSVDLTELTDEGVLSPSHVELTHSAAADAASLDHIAATDSVGGVAVETASPINTASDDSVDTDITDLADEGVAGSAHVELITSVNVEPASASNGEMVTPLKAETILASKNATKKAIKKTFDLVNVVSAVLAATGASVAKVKPPSSLAKIKKKVKSSTSTKTKAKTKSKTKAKTSAKVKDKTVSDSPGIAKNTSQAHLESTVMANVESLEVAGVETLKSTAMNESNMIVTEDHVATTTKLLDFADMENCSSRQMDQVEECIAIQQAGCGINDPEDFENASCNANMSLRDTADKKDLHSSAMDCVYLADHVSKTTQHLNPKRLLMGQLAEIAEMIARDPFVSNNGVIDAKKNGGIFTDYEDDTVGASKHNKSPSPLQDPMASQDLRNIVCEIESKEINEDEVELQSTKLCDWSSVDVDHSSNVQLKSFHKKAEDVLDVYKSQQSCAKVNVFKNRPSREEVATNSGVGHLVVASMKHVCTESFDGEMSNSASSVSSTTSSMIDNASQTEDSSTTGAIDLSADAVFGTEETYEQTSVSTTKEDFVDVNAADQNVLEQSKVDSVESTLLEKFTLEPSSNQTPKTKSAYEDEEFARTYPCMNAFINEGPIGDWASCDDDVMWGQEAHGMHVEDARSAKQSIASPSSEAKKGYNISYFMPARGKKSSKKSSRKSSKKSSKKSSRTKVITTPQVQWEQRRTQSEANEDADTASSVETRASPISWDNLSRDTDENRNSLTNACAGSSDSTSWRRAKHTNSDIADQLKVESSMEGNKKSTFVYYPGTKAGSRRKVKK